MSKQATIDTVVRESLMENQLSIHYYMRFLNLILSGVREYTFDFPFNIKETRLTLESYKAATVPTDFVDVVMVGEEKFDKVEPFVNDPLLNGLDKLDDDENRVPYTRDVDFVDIDFYSVNSGENVNSNGEYLGRYFGHIPTKKHAYRYIPEKSEIQFSIDVCATEVVLWYISDGVSVTAANVVHPYAIELLKAWVHWKYLKHFKPNTRISIIREAKDYYYNERRKLRERSSPIGIEEILMAARRGHHAGNKS